jgi:hypothetical protein
MMTFQPSAEKIKGILKRRLLPILPDLNIGFPNILSEESPKLLLFGDGHLFGVVFIDDTQIKTIMDYQKRGLWYFPGFITTDTTVPAAFRVENVRNNIFSGNTVKNSTSFFIGSDSTLIIIDHTQFLRQAEMGEIEYKIPLAYLVSFGSKITFENAYDYLEDLVAYSVSKWRKSDVG